MSYYVGIRHNNAGRQLLNSVATPTEAAYGGDYAAIIGPFRTKRAAIYMLRHGNNNPHLQCVADAERISCEEYDAFVKP